MFVGSCLLLGEAVFAKEKKLIALDESFLSSNMNWSGYATVDETNRQYRKDIFKRGIKSPGDV